MAAQLPAISDGQDSPRKTAQVAGDKPQLERTIGDDIVTERAVWVNWFLDFREPYKDIAQNSVMGLVPDNRDRRFSPKNEDAWTCVAGKLKQFKIREQIVALDKNSCALMHSS